MWQFKQGSEEQAKAFLTALSELKGVIPEVLDMEIGVSALSCNSHTAVLRVDFEDVAALDRYRVDPRHVAVASMCREIALQRADVDYEI
jgi:hypothetical protein